MSVLDHMSPEQQAAVSRVQRTVGEANAALRELAKLGIEADISSIAEYTMGDRAQGKIIMVKVNFPPQNI